MTYNDDLLRKMCIHYDEDDKMIFTENSYFY